MNHPAASCRGIEYKMQPTHKYKQPPRSKLRGIFRLKRSYRSFSVENNFLRMIIFYKYRSELLALKKRTAIRKWFFCLKMFFKIK